MKDFARSVLAAGIAVLSVLILLVVINGIWGGVGHDDLHDDLHTVIDNQEVIICLLATNAPRDLAECQVDRP